MVKALIFSFGPSGVRVLPLAAGINEGGHYSRYIIPRHMCIRVRIFKLMVNSFQFGYIFGVQHQFEVFIFITMNGSFF